MVRLLQWMLFGHIHEWDVPAKTGPIYESRPGNTRVMVGTYRECRCKKCGAWKAFNT